MKFVSCIIDFIGYIIYLEIIELKFCGLNQNLRKNIEKRASNDRITTEQDDDENDNNDSDDENAENEDNCNDKKEEIINN